MKMTIFNIYIVSNVLSFYIIFIISINYNIKVLCLLYKYGICIKILFLINVE